MRKLLSILLCSFQLLAWSQPHSNTDFTIFSHGDPTGVVSPDVVRGVTRYQYFDLETGKYYDYDITNTDWVEDTVNCFKILPDVNSVRRLSALGHLVNSITVTNDVTITDKTITHVFADCTSRPIAVTFPDMNTDDIGKELNVFKTDTTGNDVDLETTGGDTIDTLNPGISNPQITTIGWKKYTWIGTTWISK